MVWNNVHQVTLCCYEKISNKVGLLLKEKFKLSLVGFDDAFNTIRLYKRLCQGCVQTAVLSGNHKTKSAALFRLLTQIKEAPKKRNRTCRVTNDRHIKRKWKRIIVSKKEKKFQFPYVVQAHYEHCTAG